MIAFLRLCWQRKDTPWHHLAEELAMLTKMARRCAYDLDHAAGEMSDPDKMKFFCQRSRMWLSIFAPDGVKDYRHKTHIDIMRLECRVDILRAFCVQNGLDPNVVDEVLPF